MIGYVGVKRYFDPDIMMSENFFKQENERIIEAIRTK